MNQSGERTAACAVCGAQTHYHANWFLVAENRWLDHLKILTWHPALADQAEVQSVCGEEHLKVLILHWLMQADLDLQNGEGKSEPQNAEFSQHVEPGYAGKVLGEFAVHRNPLSRNWTESAQALECILGALTGREPRAGAPDFSLASFHAEATEELTYSQAAGRV